MEIGTPLLRRPDCTSNGPDWSLRNLVSLPMCNKGNVTKKLS